MGGPASYESPAGAWLAQYARARFGRETTLSQTTPSVGTSAIEILKVNPRRMSWAIFNLAVNTVTLGFDTAANATNGFPVQALGGGVTAEADEDGELVGHAVWCVSTVASQQLVVLEVVGV